MSRELTQLLKDLNSDVTIVLKLYKVIFDSTYFTFVENGTQNKWETIKFLTYDTADGIRELPLFTNTDFVFQDSFEGSLSVEIYGQELWEKLATIVESSKLEVAIDPGQSHGIRLSKEIILGMISQYGNKAEEENNGA